MIAHKGEKGGIRKGRRRRKKKDEKGFAEPRRLWISTQDVGDFWEQQASTWSR
jgi:hypothetical protein